MGDADALERCILGNVHKFTSTDKHLICNNEGIVLFFHCHIFTSYSIYAESIACFSYVVEVFLWELKLILLVSLQSGYI